MSTAAFHDMAHLAHNKPTRNTPLMYRHPRGVSMHANLAIACAAALGPGALLGLLKHTWQYGAVTCLTMSSVSAPRPVLYTLPRPSRN